MENVIKTFENKKFGKVRTVEINNNVWFVGKDVAGILGYSDTFGALKKHVDEDDKQNCQNNSFESNRGLVVINESGLYSLILSSKLDSAKEFKHWVTSEVLPSIRKHGMFAMDEVLANPDILINALMELKKEREEKNALEFQKESLQIELDSAKEWYSIKRMEKLNPNRHFSWQLLKKASERLGCEIKKVFDQNYGEVNAYHISVWEDLYFDALNYE